MSFSFNPSAASGRAFRQVMCNDYPSVSSGSGLYPSNRLYGQFSSGGNLHDTFRLDRYENLYSGHTTVDLGGGQKIHLPW